MHAKIRSRKIQKTQREEAKEIVARAQKYPHPPAPRLKFIFMEILLRSILEPFVTTDVKASEDRLQEDFLKRLI